MAGPIPVFGRPPFFFSPSAIALALGFRYRIAHQANRSKAAPCPGSDHHTPLLWGRRMACAHISGTRRARQSAAKPRRDVGPVTRSRAQAGRALRRLRLLLAIAAQSLPTHGRLGRRRVMAAAQLKRSISGGLGAAKPRLVVGRVRAGTARAPRRPACAESSRRSPSLCDDSAAPGRLG
jgi:hypothetical protein